MSDMEGAEDLEARTAQGMVVPADLAGAGFTGTTAAQITLLIVPPVIVFVLLLAVWELGVSILEDGLFGKQRWLQSHRSIVVKFLRASIQGWKYADAHTTEAGQISFRHAPSGTTTLHHQIYMAQQVAKLINYGPGLSHPIGYMDPAAYHRTWKILLQEKQIKKAPSGAYDQSYWKAATM